MTLELESPLPDIFADKVQIEQVLVNLMRNAVEAMEDVLPENRRLVIKSERLNEVVQVSVIDNGHSITADRIATIFSPFFSTKDAGMGLGLSISRSIIEAHRGRLSVESEIGHGTTFRFVLPIEAAEDSS